MLDPIDFELDAEELLEKRKMKTKRSFELQSEKIENSAYKRISKLESLNRTREDRRSNYPFIGAGLGFVASLASCSSGLPLESCIGTIVIGLLAGFGASYLAKVNIEGNKDRITSIREGLAEDLEDLAKQRDAALEQHAQERDKQIVDYKNTFEANARAQSAKFALSPITQEISSQLVKNFKNQIDSFDRSPHVPKIVVPFRFSVYSDGVTSPTYSYDFERKRVENLVDLSQQCALANAIASNIRSEIVMAFPEDPAGCAIDPLEIAFEYKPTRKGKTDISKLRRYVEASMTYSAINGNYVAPRAF